MGSVVMTKDNISMITVLECNTIKKTLEKITVRHGWSDFSFFFSNSMDWANHSGYCVKVTSPKTAEFFRKYRESDIKFFNSQALKTDLPVMINLSYLSKTIEGAKLVALFDQVGWKSSLLYPTYSYGGMMGLTCLHHSENHPDEDMLQATFEELDQWRGKFNAWARQLIENRKPTKIEEQVSTRELDCMSLVAEGMTSAEIARELGISKRTVDFHIQNCVMKLGVSTRSQAALVLFLDPMPQLAMVSRDEDSE